MTREEWDDAQAMLESLGYASFKDYLFSERGQRVRGMVLARDGYRCSRCRCLGARHIRFKRFTEDDYNGETLDYIESVCAGCLWPPKPGQRARPVGAKKKKRPHRPWSWTFHE